MAFFKNKLSKTEFAWAMYDWANSVYATIIMAALFPIYFTAKATEAGAAGDVVWGYGTSIATLIVVFLAPVLGSVADFRGMKKRLLIITIAIGCLFTLTMAIFDIWQLMLVGYVISYIGFSLSCLFYDSFLTDVTSRERMDMVSATGFALGYVGGSTVPFVIAALLLLFSNKLHITTDTVMKMSIVMASLWWAVFSIPIIRRVEQKHYIERPAGSIVKSVWKNLVKTAKDIGQNRALLLFMLAYFFYIDGVGTVIRMATSYGTILGLDSVRMLLALMITQLVAVPCSLGFAALAKKAGARKTLLLGLSVYICVCLLGFYMGYSLENAEIAAAKAYSLGGEEAYAAIYNPALKLSQSLFWLLSFLVGTCQGGIQALSRSQFGKMIPPERSNEFFGFFDIFGKFATMMGPFLYAFLTTLSGRSSVGILSLIILFAIGAGILAFVPKGAFSQQYPPKETGE